METLKVLATGAAVAGGMVVAALIFSSLMSVTGPAGGAIRLAMLVAVIYGIGRFVRQA